MNIGVLINLCENIEEKFQLLRDMGVSQCQLVNWKQAFHTDEMAYRVNEAKEAYGITVTAYWCGWSGPCAWNFTEGPTTLGLVPTEWREVRVAELKRGADFAKKIGVTDLVTHAGFLPENPTDPACPSLVECLRELCTYLKEAGQYFLFETGQETPTTLLRFIQAIGTGNVGVNLDTANLILYGKANPVDALDVIGPYVRGVHAKDGLYPTNGSSLGREVKLGTGRVDFPRFIARLNELGYTGCLTIEREISGERQRVDIADAKCYLEKVMEELGV